MIKKMGALLALALMAVGVGGKVSHASPTASITIKVTDEENSPVEGATVGVSFYETSWWKSVEIPVEGNTDYNGKFTATSGTDEQIGFSVVKDGYYMSVGKYKFLETKNGRWEPWNPEIHMALRRIEHPAPMFARDTHRSDLIIPDINKPIGFDLTIFDWVAPYGRGIYSDLIFLLKGVYSGSGDYDMTLGITFANKYDGIQVVKDNESKGSIFKLARFAPIGNYQERLLKFRKSKPKGAIESNFDDSNNYYFRVRSEVKDKRLDRAMYGKILGEIKFYPKSPQSAHIVFKYYLNPDYTRNLEYDPSQNLFLDLRDRRKLEFVDLF